MTDSLRARPADLVVYGHSHLPHNERAGGVTYFNPASAGPGVGRLPRGAREGLDRLPRRARRTVGGSAEEEDEPDGLMPRRDDEVAEGVETGAAADFTALTGVAERRASGVIMMLS